MGPRLGSVAGLETGVEQQTMGQGWLEHRSKARRAGPEAELVTEKARSSMSWRGTLEPHTQPPAPPHSSRHAPSSKDGCVPGSPVVIEDCRSCVVPKLWLDLLRKGRLSSEALGEPWSWGWESQRSGVGRRMERRNAEQKQEEGNSRRWGDAWLDIPWAHGHTPPRVLGPEQGQKTGSGHGKRARRQQRSQEGNRHGRREKKTQSEVTP